MFIPLLSPDVTVDYAAIRMNRIMANPDEMGRIRDGRQLIDALGTDEQHPLNFHIADVVHMVRRVDRINGGEYVLSQLGYPSDYCPESIQP